MRRGRMRAGRDRASRVLVAVALTAMGVVWLGVSRGGAADTGACSWDARINADVVNAAFPDTSASYWVVQYPEVPGASLVIHGTYPAVRYFSFNVYTPTGIPIDSLYDQQLTPDKGSRNPFDVHASVRAGGTYTATVDFSAAPKHPPANTMYAGYAPQGYPNAIGSMIYRIYVPNDLKDPQGQAPLPIVTYVSPGGSSALSFDACQSTPSVGVGSNDAAKNSSFPVDDPSPSGGHLTFKPSGSSGAAGFFPNQQNMYLSSSIRRDLGNVVVIHGKAPTFPDTRAGEPVAGDWQLRYWSLCENNLEAGTRVIACAPDYRTALRHGWYTFVISDPNDRPRNATAANGVTWIPWGGTFADGFLIFRNMLPSPGFHHAIQSIGQGDPAKVMGPYYPDGVYCSKAVFEKGAWRACERG